MKKDVWSIVFMVVTAAFGVACMIGGNESIIRIPNDFLGTSGFPRIVGGLLAFCALVSAAKAFFSKANTDIGEKLTVKSWKLILLSSSYILGISYLGFAVSTVIYLILISLIFTEFNRLRIKSVLIYSFSVTLVFFFFFKLFKVYLPDTIFI